MHIYALVADKLVLYVGKTVRTLAHRARQHRWVTNRCGSKEIPEWMEWEIVLLAECSDEEGTTFEQYFYDLLKPWYNQRRPGQTDKERHNTNAGKEIMRKAQARYRAKKKTFIYANTT